MNQYRFHTKEAVYKIDGFPVPESVYDKLIEFGRTLKLEAKKPYLLPKRARVIENNDK